MPDPRSPSASPARAPLRITRRGALLGLTAAWTAATPWGRASLALAAAPTERRLVVVILRGAMDGLAAVVPYGDPDLARLRAPLLPPGPGAAADDAALLDLGGFYGLHPALSGLHGMYREGMLLPVHAVGGPTRSRSHFEAQDCLESGADHRLDSGWLNRVVAALPAASGGRSPAGLSVGTSVPLLLRGPATVGAYAPHGFAQPSSDLYARLAALHRTDPLTGPAIIEGLRERGFAEATLVDRANGRTPPGGPPASLQASGGNGAAQRSGAFPALAAATGKLLAAADGPRVAALELGGWDTHTAQTQRLSGALRQLDSGLVALRAGLGEAWGQTAVLVMTEFGRTARVNGTGGTDHGTASVAFVAGGAVAGGRVLADWPGLGSGRLLEDRDLAPTTDLRALAKGLLAGHLGLGPAAQAQVFPGAERSAALSGLLRA